jgi:hypothetical protein
LIIQQSLTRLLFLYDYFGGDLRAVLFVQRRIQLNDYEEFVEKFKPKKTTDDCYTPPLVYDAVRSWATAEYMLEGRPVVRPFYPGGDYERFDYPEDCVVIDNPPFSILGKIKEFYLDRAIKFFLFAPHLTLFSSGHGESFVVVGCPITYENGAIVSTDFVTNLDAHFIRTAPQLRRMVDTANRENKAEGKRKVPKYAYPDAVISSARLGRICNVDFHIDREECYFTRALDSQREAKKTIFGCGFLIAEPRAAELRAAEPVTVWKLSEREQEIVESLG